MTSAEELDPAHLGLKAEAELCRRSFRRFAREFWGAAEPGDPYVHNWHVDAICEHLQAVAEGQVEDLIICQPPGTGKSILTSVLWPAWVWTRDPGWRSLFTSYDMKLAIRDSMRCRDVVASGRYLAMFCAGWELRGDQNVKSYFLNSAGGFRMSLSLSLRGAKAGFRGDALVVDDPTNTTDAHSPEAHAAAVWAWERVMSTRGNLASKTSRVVVMQRLNAADLVGCLLEKGGYTVLSLPCEFRGKRRCVTYVGGRPFWADPRREEGELLFPELLTPAKVEKYRRELGTDFEAQYNQEPEDDRGEVFDPSYWRFYRLAGSPPTAVPRPRGCVSTPAAELEPGTLWRLAMSVDCTFKDESEALGGKVDEVAIEMWGCRGPERFLLDLDVGKYDFSVTCDRIEAMRARWPRCTAVLVEDAANGPAVVNTMRRKMTGVVSVRPEGGKVARAWAAQPQARAGQVFLPDGAPWLEKFVTQARRFPKAPNDDLVDSMTQALLQLEMSPDAMRAWMACQG